MKKLVFVKTSPNHSRMHNRFIDRSKKYSGVEVVSVDFQEWLDIAFCQIFFGKILGFFVFNFVGRILRRFRHSYRFLFVKSLQFRALSFIRDQDASAIVLSDNYCSYIHMMLVAVARDLGIKVVCVPFVSQDYDDILQSRINSRGVQDFSQGFLAKSIARSNPEWFSEFKGTKVLWAHPLEIFSIKKLGELPKNPKGGVADYLDAVFLSGEVANERFLSYGASGKNIRIIGDIIYDHVVTACEEIDSANFPVVLFSICPDLKRSSVYGDYEKYIESYVEVMRGLCRLDIEVWISLHPSVSSSIEQSFNEEGFVFCDGDISSFIGLANLYVSSYSSTILIASALGVPAIDHDIYNLGYVGNSKLNGVEVVQSSSEFSHVMDKFVEKLNGDGTTILRAKNALFDGRVFDRFLEFFEEEV